MLENELSTEEINKILKEKENRFSLEEILNDDPLGILFVEKKISKAVTSDDRLLDSFEEINKFVDENGKEPERNKDDMNQFRLHSRLKGFRDSFEKSELLKDFDRHKLLPDLPSFDSVEDILNSDILGIFSEEDNGLFDLKNIPKLEERESTDFVARRKPCVDFENYEDKFNDIQNDLANGKRILIDFKEDNLREGSFYVHNGILMLLENINITKEEKTFKTGKRIRKDGRTRCIFENGTESNMLYRSVAKALYANGKVVAKSEEQSIGEYNKNFGGITSEDKEAGFIYVLKSKSENPNIKNIENLYKIGYSKNPVEQRIYNAENQATYLMAPVEIITSWKCFNMNPQKFENLIHNFFSSVCLDVEIMDNDNKVNKPREWFIVPLQVIEQVVELIISGQINSYYYDKVNQMIVRL